jgi:tetratricopeptide (TPR) repeat protein
VCNSMPTFVVLVALLFSSVVFERASQHVFQQAIAQTTDAANESVLIDEFELEQHNSIPEQELSASLLSELLVFNLALYENQWKLGLSHVKAAAFESKDPRLAKAAAVLAVQNKDYVTGLEMAEFWLRLQPDAEDGLDLLIMSQVNQGLVDDAITVLQSKDALSTDNIDQTVREIAGLVVQQSNGSAALDLVAKILALHPDSAQVNLSAAYVAGALGDKQLAADRLDRALEIKPGWESAALSKAELIAGADYNETRILFLQDYLTEYPESVAMRTLYAAELARARKLDAALSEISFVLELESRNVQALTYAALISAQLGNSENAQKYYRRVNDLEPNNEDALLALGRAAESESQYVSAQKYYAQIASDKNYLYAQTRLAIISAAQDQVDEAVELLNMVDPATEQEFVEIAMTRHYILLQALRLEEALGYINDSLLYLPGDARLLYARALVAAEMRDLKLAESDFKAVLLAQPKNADALNAYGYTLADQTERYQEAKALIERALLLQPNSAHILDSYGWVMYRLGELSVAREYLSRAYDIWPEVEIGVHLAEVLWVKGDQEQALEIWKDAYEKDPQSPLLATTLERFSVSLDD